MASRLRLKVGPREFVGWKSISIQRSIEAVAGRFVVEAANDAAPKGEPFPAAQGLPATIQVGDQTILDGYVDRLVLGVDAGERTASFAGRDRTGELVDCSPLDTPQEWLDAFPSTIARDLSAPFGIEVVTQTAQRRIPRFAYNPGESSYEAIERAARIDGVLAITDGQGRLVLTRGPRSRDRIETPLVEGDNVRSARIENDVSGRFGVYVVRGQHPGSATFGGLAAASPEGRVFDEGIRAQRSIVVISESPADVETARRRAGWEATYRAARGSVVEVEVQGLEHRDGVWEIGKSVSCRLPSLYFEGEALISSVKFAISQEGSTTTLGLVRPDAYDIESSLTLAPAADPGRQVQEKFAELVDSRVDVVRGVFELAEGSEVEFR